MQKVKAVKDLAKGKSRVKKMLIKDWNLVVEAFFMRFAKVSNSLGNTLVLNSKKLVQSMQLNQRNQRCAELGTIHEQLIKCIKQQGVEEMDLHGFRLVLDSSIEKAK